MYIEKPARVHFIPDLKVWAFVTLCAPIAVKKGRERKSARGLRSTKAKVNKTEVKKLRSTKLR
ncbi:hypothetical protein [Methanosarcina siciliae]|uniref:hypothetical protein n=1 Tax=Methanosarcina siciliae TaxID=38027 RepID=UPI00064E5FD9|nr:hypothetical protein [Methanosarcina siciliae]